MVTLLTRMDKGGIANRVERTPVRKASSLFMNFDLCVRSLPGKIKLLPLRSANRLIFLAVAHTAWQREKVAGIKFWRPLPRDGSAGRTQRPCKLSRLLADFLILLRNVCTLSTFSTDSGLT